MTFKFPATARVSHKKVNDVLRVGAGHVEAVSLRLLADRDGATR
jgi:hypothetical protein